MEPMLGMFYVEKFDGKGDFTLWKYKMLCQLEILGLDSTLQEVETGSSTVGPAGETMLVSEDPKRSEKEKRAKSLISLSLSDPILRKVMNEPTALDMWKALEMDYQTKTLPYRICMKYRFRSFKMDDNKSIEENLDVFFKLVSDLASLNINISEEDQAIRILTSLPRQYESVFDRLKYGNGEDTLTVRDVTSLAYAKEVELKERGLLNKPEANPEGSSKSKNRSRSRSTNK